MPAHQVGIGGERHHLQRDNASGWFSWKAAAMEQAGPDNPETLPVVTMLPAVHGKNLIFIDDEGIVKGLGLLTAEFGGGKQLQCQ